MIPVHNMKGAVTKSFKAKLRKESGTSLKEFGGRVSVALIYPNLYYTGMSNLGFLYLYQSINKRKDALCERGFLPTPKEETLFKKSRIPFCTLESEKPISQFNVVGFSVSFENDYINILKILRMANIPLLARDRENDLPLLIMGGVCASYNPEPLAPVFDLVFLGDGYRTIHVFLDIFKEYAHNGNKKDVLEEFSGKPGFYVPTDFKPVYNDQGDMERNQLVGNKSSAIVSHDWVPDLDEYPCMSELMTSQTEFGDMILIEITRGCARKCSFCILGECYGTFRARSVEVIIKQVKKGMKWRKKFGLLGPNIADHPRLPQLLRAIRDLGCEVALPSLRLDLLDQELVNWLAGEKQKTLTFAPESGSELLRSMINKPVSQSKMEEIISKLGKNQPRRIKLYLMVGLPWEEKKDVEEIITMVKNIKHLVMSTRKWKLGTSPIVLSVNCFVPKPFTPFQWVPMNGTTTLKEKIGKIKKSFRKDPYVNVIHDMPKWATIQGVLARGDRRVFYLLKTVLENNGDWNRTFKQSSINIDYYTTRKRSENEVFPWDHLMNPKLKKKLRERYKNSQRKIVAGL